ncbi:MAG: hypothetical protein AAF762_11100, partial [Pseudomonadota bacterium]
MAFDEKEPRGCELPGKEDFVLSRREFLGAAGASSLASTAWGQPHPDTHDVRLEFVRVTDPETERPVLDVLIYERPIGSDPDDIGTLYHRGWRLRPESFGPNAEFVLNPPGPRNSDRSWNLRIVNVGYGRLRGREINLTFTLETAHLREGPRARFAVVAETTVWSSQSGANVPASMTLFSTRRMPGLDPTQAILREIVGEVPPSFFNHPRLPRISNTTKLMFNGAVSANIALEVQLHRDGYWKILAPEGGLSVVGGRVELSDLKISWPRADGPTLTLGREAALLGEGTIRRPSGDPAAALHPIEIGGGSKGPAVRLESTGPLPDVRLRTQAPPRGQPWRTTEAETYITETLVAGRWHVTGVSGRDATRSLGRIPELLGSILERVEAPETASNTDFAARKGTISFQADYTGSDGYVRTASPIGVLTTRAVANSGAERASATDVTSGFPTRAGWPVLCLWSWDRTGQGAAGTRQEPWTEHLEFQLAVVEAGIAMANSEWSRLSFDDTEFRAFYNRTGISAPIVGSYFDIGAAEEAEFARLDLARAQAQASRSTEQVALKFRFQGMSLSFTEGAPALVRSNPQCDVTAAAGVNPEDFEAYDSRPTLVVEFPPQHLFEEAGSLPGLPPAPDVALETWLRVDRATGDIVAEISDAAVYIETPEHIDFDADNRAHVVDVLSALGQGHGNNSSAAEGLRETFRIQLRNRKNLADADFASFALLVQHGLRALTRRPGLSALPRSQAVYIGHFALDPDAMQVVREAQQRRLEAQISAVLTDMDIAVEEARRDLQLEAPQTFEDAVSHDVAVAAIVPVYQDFRNAYRDLMTNIFLELPNTPNNINVPDLSPESIEFI